VSLSAEGGELVERLKAGRGEWFRQMMHDWEPEEAQAFNEQLERFAESFEASRDRFKSISFPPSSVSHDVVSAAPETASKER